MRRNHRSLGMIAFGIAYFYTNSKAYSAEQAMQSVKLKPAHSKIEAGSKVFIAPMDGFETYLKAAILKQKVPVQIVAQQQDADYEIDRTPETQTASTSKFSLKGSGHSTDEVNIEVNSVKYHETVFARSVHEKNSAHKEESNAEAFAKRLKEEGVSRE